MQLPRRHRDTKVHQEFIHNDLFLVKLCALEPLPAGSAGRQVGGENKFGAESILNLKDND
jgi:hypothetical protein